MLALCLSYINEEYEEKIAAASPQRNQRGISALRQRTARRRGDAVTVKGSGDAGKKKKKNGHDKFSPGYYK